LHSARQPPWPAVENVDGEQVNALLAQLKARAGEAHSKPWRRAARWYLGERLVGRVSRELDANQAIWEFFHRHHLPWTAGSLPSSGRGC